MIRCSTCLLGLMVLAFLLNAVIAALVNSGNPINGGNAQRNRHINRKLLCPEIAPGRTQIWNTAWKSRMPYWQYPSNLELTQDENGFIYLGGLVNGGVNYIKVDSSGALTAMYNSSFSSYAIPTHIDGKLIFAGPTTATVVDSSTMQEIASVNWPNNKTYSAGSFVPYNNDIMVSSVKPSSNGLPLRYFNITSNLFVDLDQGPSVCTNAENVIIYEMNGTVLPIIICSSYRSSYYVWSPNYFFKVDGQFIYSDSYVQNDQLIVQYEEGSGKSVSVYDAVNGTLITKYTIAFGYSASVEGVVVIGNKSAASVDYPFNNFQAIIDFINNNTLIENKVFFIMPTYSIPDNLVLLTAVSDYPSGYQQLVSVDWDTGLINSIGSMSHVNNGDDDIRSPPLIGEDCTVYEFFADYLNTLDLFAYKPLPISNIQPILECITDTGVGYFSYKNMENIDIIIPFAKDRNNITPMDVAGAIEFKANQRGKYFPFSTPVKLDNNTNTFTWQLEDYTLPFSNSDQLRCPQNVTVVLSFRSQSQLPDDDSFAQWVQQQFAALTASSTDRIAIVNVTSAGEDITITLRLLRGDFIDHQTPEQAAIYFASSVSEFKSSLLSDATYGSYAISLLDYNGVPLDTEIAGTLPPQAVPPTAAPVESQTPIQVPTRNNAAPKSRVVSNGDILRWSAMLIGATCSLVV